MRGLRAEVSAQAFERGLIIELAGTQDDVLKFLPPLTIEEELLVKGVGIIDESIQAALERRQAMMKGEYAS